MRINPVGALLAAQFILTVPALANADPAASVAADREAALGRQWKEKLGLSAEQLPKFLSEVKARDAGLQPLREQLLAHMRKLQAQLTDGAPEKEVQATLDQVEGVQRAIALRRDQFNAEMAVLLAPSQRAKLLVWRSLSALPGKTDPAVEAESTQEPPPESEEEPE